MRPRGEVRSYLEMGLQAGPGTTRDLAMRTGVGLTKAMYTLRDMVSAGEAAVLHTVRVPGCCRPVPVYGPAQGKASDDGMNWDLVTCWAQWPAQS